MRARVQNNGCVQDLLWCLYTGDEPPDSADAEGLVSLLGAAHRFGCEVVQIQCEALFGAKIQDASSLHMFSS